MTPTTRSIPTHRMPKEGMEGEEESSGLRLAPIPLPCRHNLGTVILCHIQLGHATMLLRSAAPVPLPLCYATGCLCVLRKHGRSGNIFAHGVPIILCKCSQCYYAIITPPDFFYALFRLCGLSDLKQLFPLAFHRLPKPFWVCLILS